MGLNLEAIRAATAQHGTVTRVLVADHKGSTPREAGNNKPAILHALSPNQPR